MTDGPTTMNGPLHGPGAAPDARRIVAFFSSDADAQATARSLVEAGVVQTSIEVVRATADSAMVGAADDTLIGRVREAILPDDGQRAARAAVQSGETMLTVVPPEGEADRIVALIQQGGPSRFDADLERWRNNPPS